MHRLETAEADIAYDVHGPLPTADGRPPLFMIGQPMDASGFSTLASYFPDRTVITYDPRGLGRSTRKDGRVDNTPTLQAEDVHAVIDALGAGPVEMFASSGGAVTALALVAAHPDDVTTLVAHEPPLLALLPDAAAAERAQRGVRDAYQAKGSGAGMAAFMAMASWQGEYTDDYFAQPAPDPAMFGMPARDDGTRDDPLLSDRSWAITSCRPDVGALRAAPTRVVIAVGEESAGTVTARTTAAIAELLGQQPTVFPSHHGGFVGGESGYAGQPEAFARRLREILDDDNQRASCGALPMSSPPIKPPSFDISRTSGSATASSVRGSGQVGHGGRVSPGPGRTARPHRAGGRITATVRFFRGVFAVRRQLATRRPDRPHAAGQTSGPQLLDLVGLERQHRAAGVHAHPSARAGDDLAQAVHGTDEVRHLDDLRSRWPSQHGWRP